MQSITKDGVVHYITKLEDFQELMPYEVYTRGCPLSFNLNSILWKKNMKIPCRLFVRT